MISRIKSQHEIGLATQTYLREQKAKTQQIDFPETSNSIYAEYYRNWVGNHCLHLSFLNTDITCRFANTFCENGLSVMTFDKHFTLPSIFNGKPTKRAILGVGHLNHTDEQGTRELVEIVIPEVPVCFEFIKQSFMATDYFYPCLNMRDDSIRFSKNKLINVQKRIDQTEILIKHYAFYLFALKTAAVPLPHELIPLILLCGVKAHAPSLIKFSLFTPVVREHLRHRNEDVYQRIDRINQRIDEEIINLVSEKNELNSSSQKFCLSSGAKVLQKYQHELLIISLELLKAKNYEAQLEGLSFRQIADEWWKEVTEQLGVFDIEKGEELRVLVKGLLKIITNEEEQRIGIAHKPW